MLRAWAVAAASRSAVWAGDDVFLLSMLGLPACWITARVHLFPFSTLPASFYCYVCGHALLRVADTSGRRRPAWPVVLLVGDLVHVG